MTEMKKKLNFIFKHDRSDYFKEYAIFNHRSVTDYIEYCFKSELKEKLYFLT